LARRYHKPVVIHGLNCRTVDVAAYARTVGEEVLVAADNAELERTFSLLLARAVYRETRILFPTNRGFPAVASLTGITDLAALEKKFGIAVRMISFKTLAEEMERTLADKARIAKAERDADELIRGAAQSYLDRQYVVRSLLFRQAVEALMDANACNAFTIECFEFCSSRLPEKWKITPCLIHTLFKDAGYASACEADMGALLATRLLLSVSGKSSHMGNMFSGEGNTVIVNHSAPGIRMNGFGQPGLPYKLGRFVQSGWGTKAVVDFMQNTERKVTVARMHPSGDRLLVLRGLLTASEGWEKDNLGCSVQATIKPVESGQGSRFIRRQTEYGNHLSWVYGDYASELEELGRLLGIEVEVIS
jgi:L-fucose isomerase-like protein